MMSPHSRGPQAHIARWQSQAHIAQVANPPAARRVYKYRGCEPLRLFSGLARCVAILAPHHFGTLKHDWYQ